MKTTDHIRALSLAIIVCMSNLGMYAQKHKQFGFEPQEKMHVCGLNEDIYRRDLQANLQKSYDMLMDKGLLAEEFLGPRSPGSLHWPLRMAPEYENQSGVEDMYDTGNYADLNPNENQTLDWMCEMWSNARTYNGHNGADLGSGRYVWWMQEQGYMDVVAAASGQVLWVHDGAFDRNCGGPLGSYIDNGTDPDRPAYGNHVALQHAGSVTIYAHLKSGSVANLQIGDIVNVGEYLGKIGSSGNSTGPHLHFEVRPEISESFIEPWYAGSDGCNNTVWSSWWADQKPYTDTKITRVMTANGDAIGVTCPEVMANNVENPNEVNHFSPSWPMQVRLMVRDRPESSTMIIRLYSPSNVLINSATSPAASMSSTLYGTGLWWWNLTAPFTQGTYRVEAELGDQKLNHYFTVGCTASYNLSGPINGPHGYIASYQINTTHVIPGFQNNQVRYEAGHMIQFNPGFVIAQGGTMKTRIDDCNILSTVTPQYEDDASAKNIKLNSFDVYPTPPVANLQ